MGTGRGRDKPQHLDSQWQILEPWDGWALLAGHGACALLPGQVAPWGRGFQAGLSCTGWAVRTHPLQAVFPHLFSLVSSFRASWVCAVRMMRLSPPLELPGFVHVRMMRFEIKWGVSPPFGPKFNPEESESEKQKHMAFFSLICQVHSHPLIHPLENMWPREARRG